MDVVNKRRAEFAETFMSLVIEASLLQRINVVDITNAMGCNRKSFYRYFQNIDELVIWIEREELRRVVTEQFSSYPQIKPAPSLDDPYPDWPFYTRIAAADYFLEQGIYYKAIAYHWEMNRAYYESLFKSGDKCYTSLFDYLIKLFLPALKDDILFMLHGRYLSEDAINFLAEYHAMGLFGRVNWHFGTTKKFIMQDEVNPFWNHAHVTMKYIIEKAMAGTTNDILKY